MRKLILAVIAVIAVVAAGCDSGVSSPSKPNVGQQSHAAAESRAATYARAVAAVPEPVVNSFPLRQALSDLTVAQSKVNHPWYVYLQAQGTGQVIGYYVAKTAPQSTCNTMSNTQDVEKFSDDNGGNNPLILTSPSLNGYYAGGAGASGSCSTYFFEDRATSAIIEVNGNSFFVSDQPLALDVPAIRVKTD